KSIKYCKIAQNEFNYINHAISESEFEWVIENYANMVEFDNDMFNDNTEDEEELDANYISDTENLDDLLQFDSKTLEIEEMLVFNTFLDEKTNEMR
ncbi:25043_t:CDS:1, partial [Cetraspora pellucida]